jgi:hypothetical protein
LEMGVQIFFITYHGGAAMASVLSPGQSLGVNQQLVSDDGRFQLIMQSDGNLVLYRVANHHALWATGTNGQDAMGAFMQTDGNLVLYNFGGRPIWASNTAGKQGSFLVLQSDGNLVIYQPDIPVWASGTNQAALRVASAVTKSLTTYRSEGIRNPFGGADGKEVEEAVTR